MSFKVIIGYGNNNPLEKIVAVDLLVDGTLAATGNPDDAGIVVFDTAVPKNAAVAVRMSRSGYTLAEA
jgi:hypothetical protein